jgi:hypothetical protein
VVNNIMRFLFLIIPFFFFSFSPSYAVTIDSLVPCGNTILTSYDGTMPDGSPAACTVGECTICDAQVLLLKLLDFFIIFMMIFVMGVGIYAGVKLVTDGANTSVYSAVRKLLTNVVVGVGIVLCAWLIVDTVMKNLYASDEVGWGPWNAFLCKNNSREHCVPLVKPANLVGKVYGVEEYFKPENNFTCEQLGGECSDPPRAVNSGPGSLGGISGLPEKKTPSAPRGTRYLSSGKCPLPDSLCYVPENTGRECKVDGKNGQCVAKSFYIPGKENVECDDERLVCVPFGKEMTKGTRSDFSTAPVSESEIQAQLKAAGIEVNQGPYSASTLPLKQGVLDDLKKMDSAAGCSGCVAVNSLVGHSNKSSRHLQGEKSDIDYNKAKNYIAPISKGDANGWEYIGDRGGKYAGPNYYNASLQISCVDEESYRDKGHFDCCHNWERAICR